MNYINTLERVPFLYHFTDRRNLPQIKAAGGLLPLAELRRRGIEIPAPGGNDWSREADAPKRMSDYVHLCFRDSHPMEYRAREAGRIGDTIFLKIHPSVMHFDGVRFTDDVANKSGVQSVPITEAEALMDFEVLYGRTDWRNLEVNARLQQASKYEVLVPQMIPLDLIRNLPNG
ncbi:DarT ssDNA thymidine ADP-ribosyltransferase family protein [Fulvimarina pelagi]|uniref:DarT ssDNA thymidine ADP-ribosyltransferase family protein n=1 Tax=Fulvimarina pelagi TaxID=217511 RepID=UPI0009E70285|nr:DarT ssDNA thymidine ADP-ribosyltransferase family protein [Fulvimarina pelagi]